MNTCSKEAQTKAHGGKKTREEGREGETGCCSVAMTTTGSGKLVLIGGRGGGGGGAVGPGGQGAGGGQVFNSVRRSSVMQAKSTEGISTKKRRRENSSRSVQDASVHVFIS